MKSEGNIMKLFLRLSAAVVFFILLIVAFLPTIISTSWGKEYLLAWVNRSTPNFITVKHLSTNWLGPQNIEELVIKNIQGDVIATANKINTETSLFKLLWDPSLANQLVIEKLNASLRENTELKNVNINITPSTLQATGLTQQGSVNGHFTINAILKGITAHNIIKLNGHWDKLLSDSSDAELKVAAEIVNFPVLFLDQLLSFKAPLFMGMLQELLGNELNLKINQTVSTKGVLVNLNASTPKLSISELAFKINENVVLSNRFTIRLEVPKIIAQRLENIDSISLTTEKTANDILFAELRIDQFSFPLTAIRKTLNLSSLLKETTLQGNLDLSPWSLHPLLGIDRVLFKKSSIELNINPQHPLQIALNLLISLPSTTGNTQDIPLTVSMNRLHLPDHFQDLASLKMSGLIHSNHIPLINPSLKQSHLAVLNNLSIDWEFDGPENLLSLKYSGMPEIKEEAAGKISGGIYVKNVLNILNSDLFIDSPQENGEKTSIEFSFNSHNLPVKLLSQLTGKNELVSIIGNAIDVGLGGNVYLSKKPQGFMNIALHSPHLNGISDLVIKDSAHLQLGERNTELNLQITPESYRSIRKLLFQDSTDTLSLAENSNLMLDIKKLKLPLDSLNTPLSLLQTGIEANISINQITALDNPLKQTFSVKNIQGYFSSSNISEKSSFVMTAKGQSNQNTDSSWNINGNIETPFSSQGELNYESSSLSLDADLSHMPVSMLCHFFCNSKLGQQINGIIGPELDAKINAQLQNMNGPVLMDVKGKNGHILADAFLKNGIITLRKNLTAQLAVSEELGNIIAKDFLPFATNIRASNQPISLKIQQQGFSASLKDFNLATTSIEKATLDLGKVHFLKKSELSQILSLLTTVKTDELSVWLTPAFFSISNGIVKLERIDLLINDLYPIAAWGTVNIPDNKVRMTIGLSGNAIGKAFGLSNIPNGYMLQLPLKGGLDSASIDKAKATARISALVAQTQGGVPGLVIGTVLEIANGSMKSHSTPQPTTKPLPWQNLLENQPESKKNSDDTPDKKKSTTIDEIGKEASSLIKKLFSN